MSFLHVALNLAVIGAGVFPVELVEELLEDVLEVGVGAFQQVGLLHRVLGGEEDALAVHIANIIDYSK